MPGESPTVRRVERRDLLADVLPIAKALRRIEDRAAGARGLTMWQYAVLSVADALPGSNQAQVAAALDYSRNRLIADVDRLADAGLIERVPGADRRNNLLRVTERGRVELAAVRAAIHAGEDELLDGLSATTRADLRRSVRALGARLRDG